MKMKKILILMLAFVIMTVSFAGCAGKKETNGNDTVEILWYNAQETSNDHALVIDEVNKLLKEKINATLTLMPIKSSEYAEKMQLLIGANQKFDLCFTARNTRFNNYGADGIFLELDELLESHGKDILELIPEYVFDGATIDGKIYAVPALKDWPHHPAVRYNKSLAEKYNFDMESVKTLADLEPMLKTIKDNEPTYMPLLNRGNANWFRILPFESISGSSLAAFRLGDYSKVINKFDTDEAREYFSLMRSWYKQGFVRSDAATATEDTEYTLNATYFAAYGEALPYTELKGNIGKSENKQTKYTYGIVEKPLLFTGDIQGAMQAISSNSDHPEKTMEFLNLLYTDAEVKNLITLGIEGKHYVKTDDVHYTYPENVTRAADTGYNPSNEYNVGNRFLSLSHKDVPGDIWEKYREYNESATVSEALGFNFNPENVLPEISAVENVYKEFMPSLLVGSVDPDEVLPKALAKFKTAGIDLILEEIQTQYDEWKKTK